MDIKLEAEKYLLSIGFDTAHLPTLFNDSDNSNYAIEELMAVFADHVICSEYGFTRSMNQVYYQLLLDFKEEAKNHVGKVLSEVPELMAINSSIEIVEKYLPKRNDTQS